MNNSDKKYKINTNYSDDLMLLEGENQFRHLIDMSPSIIFVHQAGRIVFANPRAIEDLGGGQFHLIGHGLEELVSVEHQEMISENIEKVLNNEAVERAECKLISLDGREIYIEAQGTKVSFQGKPAVMVVGQDITEKKKLQDKLMESEQLYTALFEQNANWVSSLDLEGYFKSCNSVSEAMTGYQPTELLEPMHFSAFIHPNDKDKAGYYFEQCRQGLPQNFEISLTHKQGAVRHVNTTMVPIKENGQVVGIFSITQDITQQVEIAKNNEHLAMHDQLTGLPNRTMLTNHLKKELQQAERNNQSVAVLFLDLDRFKNINETLGHNMGDLLLKQVVERLKQSLNNQIIFRQGGDEFIMVLSDADLTIASTVAQEILDVLAVPFTINHYDIYSTASVGISVFPEDGKTVDSLIKHADFAMYQAKKAGKNTFKFYSYSRHHGDINPLKLEMELYRAVERNQFALVYQPKVNLKTGKIIGVEALLRWNHPKYGVISPATFIPIAEETGLIIPIGEWVLTEACKQMKAWQQQEKCTSMVVSVNLSARQFKQHNLRESIAGILQETGLDPMYLELEITESLTADMEHTIQILEDLKKLGIRISIDDFGTGFSSLNYLKKFPVDTLKIDRSFIQNLQHNVNDKTIVKTIISMAHNLNLSVVAEGIENKAQLEFLQQHLCEEGQGYLFAKPLTVDELEQQYFAIETVVKDFGLLQDVSLFKWSEELVRQARNELTETIRFQQGMIFKYIKVDGQFIHTLCDGELLYRLGLIPTQVVGNKLHDFYPKDVADEKLTYYERAWNGEEVVHYEAIVNGIHYFAALKPVRRGGEVVEVIGSCVDISERKSMERQLLESQRKYQLIAENMSDLIGILDSEGKCLYASPSHESMLGYPLEQYEGSYIYEYIHEDDVEALATAFRKMTTLQEPLKTEIRSPHRDGGWRLLECVGSPVTLGNDGDGAAERYVLVGRDITAKRQAEEQLWKSEKLQVVGELAAGVAHEIRNPLTSIKGFIQLFQKGQINSGYYDLILREISRVEEIIREFLALAKPREIQQEVTDIPVLIQEVGTLLESEAHLKNIEFVQQFEAGVPRILCDPNQIKQVLINIIKNSMESIQGTGTIEAKVYTVPTDRKQLVIEITDSGVGISEERLQRLGEPFYSNKEKGTGLGLMMCYRIIKQHNGTLNYTSKLNQGTTATIKLPIRR